LNQRIGIVSTKADNISEARITYNMLVCQFATYSLIYSFQKKVVVLAFVVSVRALIRDIEVCMTNENTLPAHALETSVEEATKQRLWNLKLQSRIPDSCDAFHRIRQYLP
jgi:hypothetical protein